MEAIKANGSKEEVGEIDIELFQSETKLLIEKKSNPLGKG